MDWVAYKQQNVFLTLLEAGKFKVEMPAHPLHASQTAPFSTQKDDSQEVPGIRQVLNVRVRG